MLRYFLKNPRNTGTLCSSSRKLGKAMIQDIDLENAHYIAEIGPGLGVFTQEILKLKSENAEFFVVEINQAIAKKLQQKLANIDIEIENALHLSEILARRHIESLDVIVSGLPWSIFTGAEQDRLLACIYDSLKTDGYFTLLPIYCLIHKHENFVRNFLHSLKVSKPHKSFGGIFLPLMCIIAKNNAK